MEDAEVVGVGAALVCGLFRSYEPVTQHAEISNYLQYEYPPFESYTGLIYKPEHGLTAQIPLH